MLKGSYEECNHFVETLSNFGWHQQNIDCVRYTSVSSVIIKASIYQASFQDSFLQKKLCPVENCVNCLSLHLHQLQRISDGSLHLTETYKSILEFTIHLLQKENFSEEITHLSLPDLLIVDLLKTVHAARMWISVHFPLLGSITLCCVPYLCWSDNVTEIDYKRSAKVICNSTFLLPDTRWPVALVYNIQEKIDYLVQHLNNSTQLYWSNNAVTLSMVKLYLA